MCDSMKKIFLVKMIIILLPIQNNVITFIPSLSHTRQYALKKRTAYIEFKTAK